LFAASAMTSSAWADETLSELEQRLAKHGVESVNTRLLAHGGGAMASFNRKTAACELHAVSLAVRLARSTQAAAVQAHGEALRAASGACPAFVLALATAQEVPRYCTSLASWGPAQTARELRRRIGAIDADESLRASRSGQACKAAYLHELHHTRVVVRPVNRGATRTP
jgi:hypothetical protein